MGSLNSWIGGRYRPEKAGVEVACEAGRHGNFACGCSLMEMAMFCAEESARWLSDSVSVSWDLSPSIRFVGDSRGLW